MDDQIPPADPQALPPDAAAPDAAEHTASVQGFVNLIDPKLKARALKRLQGIVKGNGIKAEDVSLESCDAIVYPFAARTFVKLGPQYGVRTEPGMNKVAELVPTAEAFNLALHNTVVQSRTEPEKRKQVIDFLFQRPDKGFGMKDQKVSFHSLTRDFVMHEGCITCSKIGKIQCQKCTATGQLLCATCQGRKQINCPQCRGSGKTPGSSHQHSCTKCHGDGKVRCTECLGRGQNKCPACAATGTLKCQKCAGSGWLSQLAHVEMEAQIHFDFDRQALPVEVEKMVTAFGARLVEKNDIEVMLHPQPTTKEEIEREIREQKEPDDTIFIDYTAKVPFGPIQFRLRDRVIPATLFGYHGKLIEAPSFLDDLTRKGQDALGEAAEGIGDVGDKVRRAAKYRMLCDVILQAAGKARQRQAIDILTNRYPTGISADKMLSLLINADKALKVITRKPRTYGLVAGVTLFVALDAAYYLGGGRIAAGIKGAPEAVLAALDLVMILFGTGLVTMASQAFAIFAQKKTLAGLAPPELLTRTMPKAGKTVWWALGLTVTLWLSILLGSLLLLPSLAPVWAQHLWTALSE